MTGTSSSVYQNRKVYRNELSSNRYASAFPQHRLVVGEHSPWLDMLKPRLEELTSLQENWDGYYGQPVSFSNAFLVGELLQQLYIEEVPAPDLIPGSDGSLQIEWHFCGIDIEIDIVQVGKVSAYFCDNRQNFETELELSNNFLQVWQWLSLMGQRALEAAEIAA